MRMTVPGFVRRSLYWKIVGAFMAVLLMSTVLHTAFLVLTLRGSAVRYQESLMLGFARQTGRRLARAVTAGARAAQGLWSDAATELTETLSEFPQLQAAFAPLSGGIRSTPGTEAEVIRLAALGEGPRLVKLGFGPRKAGVVPIFHGGRRIGTVAVAVAPGRGMANVALLGWLGILTVPLLFAVSALAAVAALRFLRRRLAPVPPVLTAIQAGDFSRRLPERDGDEVDGLFVAFNAMASRVEQTITRLENVDRGRRDFLVEVGHELKTPLTAVEGSLEELMLRAAASPDEQHLARAYGEAVRIRGLVADLIESARMEEPRYSLTLAPVNVQRLLTRVLERYGLLFARRSIAVRTTFGAEPIVTALDERRMEQVTGNLLQNALDHASPGCSLTVSAERSGDRIRIVFQDDGEGMAAERLEAVKDGATAARGRGVGLTIVRKLVELHGGAFEIASEPGRGTRVAVELPATPPGSPTAS